MILRAWGRGMKVCVIQFIKAEAGQWGEIKAAKKLGIEWYTTGDGFTWLSKDMDETTARRFTWLGDRQGKNFQRNYDLIVLDEFTYTMTNNWLDTTEVLEWLRINRPSNLHLVITGRSAPVDLIKQADLVTEMLMIKHPFEQGVQAQPGIEF